MKKAISSLLLSAMMLASAQPLQVNAAASGAVLTTRSERLTVAETVENAEGQLQEVPAGTLKVSIVISNNPGIGPCGIGIPFDPTKLEVVLDKDHPSHPLVSRGPASAGLNPYYSYNYSVLDPSKNNNKKGTLSFGALATKINKKNDVIVSFYLKARPNVNLNNYSIKDLVTPPVVDRIVTPDNTVVQHTEPKKIEVSGTALPKDTAAAAQNATTVVDYKYVLGDVDGDGKITLKDAQAACCLIYDEQKDDYISLDVNTQLPYNAANASALYKGVFVTTDYFAEAHRCELKVADVDKNGVVNMADSKLILRYYTNTIVSGNGYGNPYGLGQIVNHTVKVGKINCP